MRFFSQLLRTVVKVIWRRVRRDDWRGMGMGTGLSPLLWQPVAFLISTARALT